MSPRAGSSRVALSATMASGARLHASRVPDDVLAAAREEQDVAKLHRRIARWRRLHRVW